MRELNELIELFKNIHETKDLEFLRNNYKFFVNIQENIILEKLIEKINNISENLKSHISKHI